MTTYTLGSSSLVSAPGTVRWAIEGFHFESDRYRLTNIIATTWGIPARALLSKKVPFRIVDREAVQFTYPVVS